MGFFKSVFSDEPEPTPLDSPNSESQEPDAWSFRDIARRLISNYQSVTESYRRDIHDLRSGILEETDVIRQVASRAVHHLPASLDAGASVAQESLETVGQAIDHIGSTVWNSISYGIAPLRDLHPSSSSSSNSNNSSSINSSKQSLPLDARRYSRFDMQVRALQCDLDTYCTEPGEKVNEYTEWRRRWLRGVDEYKEDIESLLTENPVIKQIYDEVVPSRVAKEDFWARYFYRMHLLAQAEDIRAKLVKRAIAGEEEEDLSWDFDDDEEQGNGSLPKEESSDNVVKKTVIKLNEKIENLGEADQHDDNFDKAVMMGVEGKKGDNGGESCKDGDISVVSSQSLPEGEDPGWDEIEDIGSNDDSKREAVGSKGSMNTSKVDLQKRLHAAEEEEDLSWDIEDEDDVSVKQ